MVPEGACVSPAIVIDRPEMTIQGFNIAARYSDTPSLDPNPPSAI